MFDLTGKVAVVTGAGRGIGRSISVALASCGALVVPTDVVDPEPRPPEPAAAGAGRVTDVVLMNVTDSAAADAAFGQVLSAHGRIDILVNNAGITADNLFLMMPEGDWDRVIATTLKGFYNMTKPLLRRMLRQKRGSVVSIASVAGLIGNKGQANYSAAKAGLIGASRSIASEIAKKGIRVNVVAPGLIETDMISEAPVEMIKNIIPMGRIGKPEEVAKVVRFLCSDDASYITGQVISVNGGMM